MSNKLPSVRLTTAVFLTAVSIIYTNPAQAFESLWISESQEYSEFSCSGCHTTTNTTNLRAVASDSPIAHDETNADVTLQGLTAGASFTSWRYRFVGSGVAGTLVNAVSNTTYNLSVGSRTSPIEIEYCLLAASGNNRNWNCSTTSILRSPPPVVATPGTISLTQSSYTVTEGQPLDVPVVRSGGDDGEVSVTISLVDESAEFLSDYERGGGRPANDSSGTFRWDDGASGPASAPFSVNALSDAVALEGNETFTIKLSNFSGATAGDITEARVTIIDATSANNAPTITSSVSPVVLQSGSSVDVQLNIVDEDFPDDIELSATSEDTAIAMVSVVGDDTIRVVADESGNTLLRIDVFDSQGSIGSLELPVVVEQTGPAPSLTLQLGIADTQTLEIGEVLSFVPDVISNQTIFGPDYRLTLSATVSSSGVVRASSPGNDGSILVEPLGAGTATVKVTAADTLGAEASASFTVTVLGANVNNAPNAKADEHTLANSSDSVLLDVLANDNDPEDDNLTIILPSSTTTAGGTVVIEGNQVRYSPPSSLAGNDTFSYSIKDTADNLSNSVTVTLLYSSPPTGNPGIQLVNNECLACHAGGVNGAPLFNDKSAWDALIVRAGGQPQNLLGSVKNGLGSLMPAYGTRFSDEVLLQAIVYLTGREEDSSDTGGSTSGTDGGDTGGDTSGSTGGNTGGGSENTAPTAQADTRIIKDPNVSVLIDVLVNDNDADGDELIIVLSSNRSTRGNNLAVENNQVRYTPTSALLNEDTFTYRVRDTSNAESAPVTVTVIPSDEDGDGKVDTQDNCPILSNSDQLDSDSDGEGDLCDVTPNGPGSTEPLTSGKSLVEQECLVCHLNGTLGAARFGDKEAWEARIQAAGGEPVDMLASVQNGIGSMPAFGDRFSARELQQALLYLSGRENLTPGTGPKPGEVDGESDLDLDDILDANDNCVTVPNNNQSDSDGDGVGDVCERLADSDNDGYPYSLDDDDSNANRILASSPVTNESIFFSQSDLSLGPVASEIARLLDYASAAVVMNETDFVLTGNDVFGGAQVVKDQSTSSLMGIIDISAKSDAGNKVDVVVQLSGLLPLNPVLRLYNPNLSAWLDFDSSGTDSVSSSPAGTIGCPKPESSNYQLGLTTGNQCVKVTAIDGGGNDWDAQANGTLPLMMNIGRAINPSDDDGSPATINLNPSRGGGGGAFALLMLMFVLVSVRACRKHSNTGPLGY